MITYNIYLGTCNNEFCTKCKESYTNLSEAIADFLREYEDTKKRYPAVSSLDFKVEDSEKARIEIQKLIDGDIEDWKEVDFAGVDQALLESLKKVVGPLSGWLQSEDFYAE